MLDTSIKIIKTLKLEREQVDNNLLNESKHVVAETIERGTVEDAELEFRELAYVFKMAKEGQYSKICKDGYTLMLLNQEQIDYVDRHFQDLRKGIQLKEVELHLEVFDGQVLIDKVKQSEIQY